MKNKMHSYNIGYICINGNLNLEQSETQFDLEEKAFEDMFLELWELFTEYCKENHLYNVKINYVEEAPYDGYKGE